MFKDYVGQKLNDKDYVVGSWQTPNSPYAIFQIVGFTKKMVKIVRVHPAPKLKNDTVRRYGKDLIRVDSKLITYKLISEVS